MHNCCYLVCGEKSGDQLGSHLMQAIIETDPTLSIQGVGGKQMRERGLKGTIFQEELSVMGFFPVLRHLPHLIKTFLSIRRQILQLNPRFVVLIDYPDFNLRLAKSLRKAGYTGAIIQMVLPTVWAWRRGRVKYLEKYYNAVFSIYPFERKCFTSSKPRFYYTGNPVADIICSYQVDPGFFEKTSLNPEKPLLALFPGSRTQEVDANFSFQLKSAKILQKELVDLQIAVCATESTFCAIQSTLNEENEKQIPIVAHHQRFDLMHFATAAIATSGTVTLELSLFQTPSVVTYHLNYPLRLLSKVLQKRIRFFSLPNLLVEKKLFPEFVCSFPYPEKIASSLKELIENPHYKKQLSCIEDALCPGSSKNKLKIALQEILSL